MLLTINVMIAVAVSVMIKVTANVMATVFPVDNEFDPKLPDLIATYTNYIMNMVRIYIVSSLMYSISKNIHITTCIQICT